MAINKAEIINYQAHTNSTLEFSKGLNVIYGDNGQGKSCILRALKWCLSNKPQGFSFQNKQSKKDTSVTLTIDDLEIIRVRGKSKNQYEFNNQTFKALRTEIPEEITSHLNLSEHCYRSQHDQYFLFNDSDGEVAKKINKVTGLSIIDEILTKAKQLKNENKQNISKYNEEFRFYKEKFDSYKGLKTLREKFSVVEDREIEKEELVKTHSSLSKLVENVKRVQVQLDRLSFVTGAAVTLKQANESKTKLADLIKQHNQLENFISYFSEIEEELEKSEKISSLSSKINKDLIVSIQANQKLIFGLQRLIKETKNISNGIEIKKEEIDSLTKKLNNEKKKLGLCPICKKPF